MFLSTGVESLYIFLGVSLISAFTFKNYTYELTTPQKPCPKSNLFECPSSDTHNVYFQSLLIPNGNFSPVQNLPNVIDTIAQDNHCLILLRNFHFVDLPLSLNAPVILTKPALAYLWRNPERRWSSSPEIIWLYLHDNNIEKLQNNSFVFLHNNRSFVSIQLAQSTYWSQLILPADSAGNTATSDGFIRLNLTKYWRHTKLWNCLVNVGMHPPTNIIDGHLIQYPKVFTYPYSPIFRQVNIFPSQVPNVHLFIIQHGTQTFTQGTLTELMLQSFGERQVIGINKFYPGHLITHDIFFLVTTKSQKRKQFLQFSKIQNITFLTLCRRYDGKRLETANTTDAIWKLSKWKQLSSVKCEKFHVWHIQTEKGPKEEPIRPSIKTPNISPESEDTYPKGIHHFGSSTIIDELLTCMALTPQSILTDQRRRTKISDKIVRIYVHIWASIMGNYSYHLNKTHHCKNGQVISIDWANAPLGISPLFEIHLNVKSYFHPFSDGTHTFPLVVEESEKALKFLSCGRRGLETFAFDELLNVFDMRIWCLTLISTVSVAALLSDMKDVLSVWKALLEQGNPFPFHNFVKKRFRWLAGAFLLAGVVLSNAYKNTNVYSMIVRRKAIPYERFEELVQDNFTIFTRAAKAVFNVRLMMTMSKLGNMSVTNWNITQHELYEKYKTSGYSFQVKSEVEMLREKRKRSAATDDEDTPSELVVKWSSLGKYVPLLVQNEVKFGTKSIQVAMKKGSVISDTPIIQMRMQNKFRFQEEIMMFRFLKQCRKTAVVLPEYECIKNARDLQDAGHQHVFVGKETYLDMKIAFALKGLVPPHLVHRIKSSQSSGIWTKLVELVEGTIKSRFKEAKREPIREPSMEGNILVIFCLLGGGLFVAGVMFAVEGGRHYIKRINESANLTVIIHVKNNYQLSRNQSK